MAGARSWSLQHTPRHTVLCGSQCSWLRGRGVAPAARGKQSGASGTLRLETTAVPVHGWCSAKGRNPPPHSPAASTHPQQQLHGLHRTAAASMSASAGCILPKVLALVVTKCTRQATRSPSASARSWQNCCRALSVAQSAPLSTRSSPSASWEAAAERTAWNQPRMSSWEGSCASAPAPAAESASAAGLLRAAPPRARRGREAPPAAAPRVMAWLMRRTRASWRSVVSCRARAAQHSMEHAPTSDWAPAGRRISASRNCRGAGSAQGWLPGTGTAGRAATQQMNAGGQHGRGVELPGVVREARACRQPFAHAP